MQAAGCGACSDRPDGQLPEKIGQMLMIGFRGLEVEENSPVIQDIREGRIGGVIVFDYDVELRSPLRCVESPEQLKKLIRDLQAASDDTLLVAVDQEGGRVARLKERHGFSQTVSQAWLGEQDEIKLTIGYSSQTAATLRDVGINVNLAPVVDLNVNPDNPVIGGLERSFSPDPLTVTRHAAEIILSHRAHNVLTALKHFPGHGSSANDTHLGFTDVTETWSPEELVPYIELIQSPGADMIMTAHVFNSNLDPVWPATLSRKTLNDLLRVEIGYEGVIISDDMQMGAIRQEYDLKTALERTILAGTDIIIFGNNLVYEEGIAKKAQEIILGLVKDGKIPASRIQESYDRIKALKKKLGT